MNEHPDKEFLRIIRENCDSYGIVLVWDEVWISSTYACESLSIRAAIASLGFIRDNPVTDHIEKMGTRLLHGWREIADAFPRLCTVSGIPQMNTIGLCEGLPDLQNLEGKFFREILNAGFIIKRHGYNFVSYAHTERQIDECWNAVQAAFERIASIT